MNRLNRSVVNMFSSLAGYGVPMLLNLVTTPLLLKGLGEAAYGIQSLIGVIIGYMTLMDMQLDLPIMKYLAEDHAKQDGESENRLLCSTLQFYMFIGLIGMLVIIFMSDFLAKHVFSIPSALVGQSITVFQLAGIGFLGSMGASWGRAVTQGLQRFDLSQSISVTTSTLGIMTGLCVVYAGYGVIGYVLMRVVFLILSGPLYLLFIRRYLPDFRFCWGIDRAILHRIKAYVGYGLFNRIVGSILSRLDQTLISAWISVAQGGIYAIQLMITNSLGYMMSYMLGFIFPMASELYANNQLNQLRHVFIQSLRFLTALSLMTFIPLFIYADVFLSLWLGENVALQAKGVLRLLVLASFWSTITETLTNNVLIAIGLMKEFSIFINIRAFIVMVLNILLIPRFGMEGAAAALLISQLVNIVYLSYGLRILDLSGILLFKSAYFRPFFLGALLGILLFSIHSLVHTWLELFFSVISFVFLYILIGFCIGVFGDIEKKVLIGLRQTLVRQWSYYRN